MKKVLLYLALPMLMGMTFVACEDDEKVDKDLEQGAAYSNDVTQIDAMTGTISDLVNDYSLNTEGLLKSTSIDYPQIDISSTSYPTTVTVDFGTTPINVTLDGRTVKVSGSITISKTKAFYVTGSQQVAILKDFTIDGYEVDGTVTWKNKGRIGAGSSWVFNRSTGLAFITPEGQIHYQSADYDFGLLGGFDDEVDDNEVMQITGSVTGDISELVSYTHTIDATNPVVIKAGCRWAVKGTIEVTNNSGNFILDLGEGTCDNIATIQRADGTGDVYTIKMD